MLPVSSFAPRISPRRMIQVVSAGGERYNPYHYPRVRGAPERMELEIMTETHDDICSVTLNGELDVYSAPRLKEELVSRIDGGCSRLVLNMEGVGFVDSSGLGVLVSALRRARERDGGVRIVCTKDNILKIFRITGLDKVFPIFSDVAEAQRF